MSVILNLKISLFRLLSYPRNIRDFGQKGNTRLGYGDGKKKNALDKLKTKLYMHCCLDVVDWGSNLPSNHLQPQPVFIMIVIN